MCLAGALWLFSGVSGAEDFVVTNAAVFDGEQLLAPTNVVVRDGVIAAVGDDVDTGGLVRVDGSGGTLLPGLLDSHAHTGDVEQLREALRFGVTTVFDVGTFPPYGPILREAAATRTDIADFRSSGIMGAAPGGHGTEFGIDIPTVASADEAAEFIQGRVDEDADYVKIVLNGVRHANDGMPTLDADTVHALTREAHAAGLMVVAHIESVEDTELAIEAGVDGLVHHWRDSGAQPELAQRLAENDIFVMPTPTAPDGMIGTGPDLLMNDPMIAPYLSELSKEQLTKDLDAPPGMTIDMTLESIKSIYDAGVLILTGADAFVGNPRIVHGASIHRLMELFVEAGIPPIDVLRAATANVADAFGLPDRGRIQPGLRADLLLVNGDPTTDILQTRDIAKVWRQGHEADRRPVNQTTWEANMINTLSKTIAVLILAGLGTAHGQSDPLDAVNVSPDLYKVLFENEHVRVVEYRIEPGVQEDWHTHPAKVAYVVEPGTLEITTPDGNSFVAEEERGSTRWLGRVGRHYGKNVGESAIHIVFVEVKGVDGDVDDLGSFTPE